MIHFREKDIFPIQENINIKLLGEIILTYHILSCQHEGNDADLNNYVYYFFFLIFCLANLFILEIWEELWAITFLPFPHFGYTNVILYASCFKLSDVLGKLGYLYWN